MPLVSASQVAKFYGQFDVFQGVTVSIPHGARIALVGPNGSGKTTLLRILARLDEPSEGTVSIARGVKIGFLPQEAELQLGGDGTLWDEMVTVFAELRQQESRLAQLAEALARQPDDQEMLVSYGEAQARFEAAGGYEYGVRIQQVLIGLGFDQADQQRPLRQLSGGQKTRALLARLLLENPDLLILDEPTNHLDIEAVEWLEGWLKSFRGALLVVSHDRYFMDNVVNHIWELMFGRLEVYRGIYSHYVQQREDRHTRLLNEYARQQEHIAREEDYIKRNIAGQNTRQAQGRRKRLERFLREEALYRPREQNTLRLRLQAHSRSGEKVLMTKKLVIGYHDDGLPLFSVPDITLYRGECAALIGPNGAGKSTFLKTVLGHLAPLHGEALLGAGVEIGYFAQAHEGLRQENTLLDEILSVRDLAPGDARTYLANFLFTGDDVHKKVASLSGGERGRVALAKLALGGANLLLLDEPTNHLDIPSQEILEAVLSAFNGTILLVSHDRYLIRSLASQIWALHVPRGAGSSTRMIIYEGPYDEYLTWRDSQQAAARAETAHQKEAPQPPAARPTMSRYDRNKRLAQVEARIHQLEIEIVDLSGALQKASTGGDVAEVTRLGEAYQRTEAELNGLMEEWETLLADP